MAKTGGTAVSELADKTFYHDVEKAAIAAMKEDAKNAIRVFSDSCR